MICGKRHCQHSQLRKHTHHLGFKHQEQVLHNVTYQMLWNTRVFMTFITYHAPAEVRHVLRSEIKISVLHHTSGIKQPAPTHIITNLSPHRTHKLTPPTHTNTTYHLRNTICKLASEYTTVAVILLLRNCVTCRHEQRRRGGGNSSRLNHISTPH